MVYVVIIDDRYINVTYVVLELAQLVDPLEIVEYILDNNDSFKASFPLALYLEAAFPPFNEARKVYKVSFFHWVPISLGICKVHGLFSANKQESGMSCPRPDRKGPHVFKFEVKLSQH